MQYQSANPVQFNTNLNTNLRTLFCEPCTMQYQSANPPRYLELVAGCATRNACVVVRQSLRLGLLTGLESRAMVAAHCEAAFIVGEPFRMGGSGPFENGTGGGSGPFNNGSGPFNNGTEGGSGPFNNGTGGGGAPFNNGTGGGSGSFNNGTGGGSGPFANGTGGGSGPFGSDSGGGSGPFENGTGGGSAPFGSGSGSGSDLFKLAANSGSDLFKLAAGSGGGVVVPDPGAWDEPYRFGEARMAERVARLGPAMLEGRLRAPPAEAWVAG
jgi:hypothetical protein